MSLVLPTPPGPASVISRAAESARRSVASSRSRPTSGVTGTGGAAAGREGAGTSVESCDNTAASTARSSAPGSSPTSSMR